MIFDRLQHKAGIATGHADEIRNTLLRLRGSESDVAAEAGPLS
jgi:hypothetical protein